jgi:cyclic-di-GMP-binding protein
MSDPTELPIGLSSLPVSEWLELLAELPPGVAAKQINQTLQQLRTGDVSAEILLPTLNALTPTCVDLALRLTQHAIAHSAHSVPGEDLDNNELLGKLGLQILKQLSVLYFRVTDHPELLTPQQMEMACFLSIQVAGYCQCGLAVFYEAPSETLWKKTAEIYRYATEQGIAGKIQPIVCKQFELTSSILSCFKRNLLFAICHPRFYSAAEILRIFAFTNRYADFLEISDGKPNAGFSFYWSQSGEEPCQVRHLNNTLPKGYLAILTARLGNALSQQQLETHLSPLTDAQLTLQFSAYYELFQSISPGASLLYRIVFGVEDIAAYLQEHEKRSNIKFLSLGDYNHNPSTLDDLSLVPIDSNPLSGRDAPINPFAQHSGSNTGKIVHLYETPKPNFIVAEGQLLSCLTGDLAVIHNQARRDVNLAIVRQQIADKLTRKPYALLEKIAGEPSIHWFNSGTGKQRCIILKNDQQPSEIFLPPGKLQIGQKIILGSGQAKFLTRCKESNSFYSRFEIAAR